ncbi:MAG: hypothetical protein R3C30_12135 [Hyphomonadaceae bacterium]
MAPSIQLTRVTAEHGGIVARLMQFYIYDFTELLPPAKIPDLEETGDFGPYPDLSVYWSTVNHTAWLIHADGKLAGFALLNDHSHLGRPVDFNMAEFFIARPSRRRGVARAAFHRLLNMHPGTWEVAIGACNKPAQGFWPSAIAAANVSDLETLEGDRVAWTGPILRFRV